MAEQKMTTSKFVRDLKERHENELHSVIADNASSKSKITNEGVKKSSSPSPVIMKIS